ncbi:hypothetical protein EMIHUDRAFT_354732 [Emiliania huxleyi CCMP1516]|uniref:DCD domain-containing protein n=2 Tax=Emiliania huxleyi TaxID=2903 RepID=A0A0D3JFH6_EMIH1|nr:hypothetical protein EMIHUDRAFT_354732 [Emiliania huxleyi CCMP1516]EOD22261.1 hypothetical protein EMIHUDRAFT_354732 [Emiliania huxleyi CCMP1516]|eukprot:XP_005774690.1 hypothetical protein EMIHUDRAFT_354732 [Emiliania huxleyi CCMP1516]
MRPPLSATAPQAGPAVPLSAAPLPGEQPVEPAAGVIFSCTDATFEQCYEMSVVGLPRKYLPLVGSIAAGRTLLFLFNFSTRAIHGVYLATSEGTENLHPGAFTAGSARDVGEMPDEEAEIKHVLEYTERQRFRFKLSRYQCRDLLHAMARNEARLRADRLLASLP